MQITKEQIEKIFEKHTHQAKVVEDIYRLAFPDYDQLEKINGFPEAGAELNQLIWKKMIEFDRTHHPDVMSGGIWLNHGFSQNKELGPWELDASKVSTLKIAS
jgi:hypothetical protein